MVLSLIRHFLMGAAFFGSAVVCSFLFMFRPFDIRNGTGFTRLSSGLALFFSRLEYEIRGFEKIQGQGVLISNHQNNWDMVLLAHVLPDGVVTMGKKEIIWVPFFGIVYYLSNHILINRQDSKKAQGTINKACEFMKKTGYSLWVLPEGTRSRGRGLLPFKKGAFHVAAKTGSPIYPAVLSNTDKFIDLKKWNPGKAIFEVLDPITVESDSREDIEKAVLQAHEAMAKALKRLEHELS